MKRFNLAQQCEDLSWPLVEWSEEKIGMRLWKYKNYSSLSPEEIVVRRLTEEGYDCAWCEGASINLSMKAACLDLLTKINPFSDRLDAVTRYFEAQCTIHNQRRGEIIESIRSVERKAFIRNIEEICQNPTINQFYPRVDVRFIVKLFDLVGPSWLAEVAKIFTKAPYDYRSGWLDITILAERSIRFIEVKTSDKLHTSQIRFAKEVASQLGLTCQVVRLKPLKE